MRSLRTSSTPMRTRPPVHLLAFLLALALVAAACGSSSDSDAAGTSGTVSSADTSADDETNATVSDEMSDDSADDGADTDADESAPSSNSGTTSRLGLLLDDSFAQAGEATSGRFSGEMAFGLTSGDSFSMSFEGSFDTAAEASDVEMQMDLAAMMESMGESADLGGLGAGLDEPIRVRSIGDTGWIQWGFFSLLGVQTGQWVEMSQGEASSITSGLGAAGAASNGPMSMIESLRDADAEITEVGRETVRGVETTHYSAVIDLEAAADELDEAEKAELESRFGQTEFPVDFWIGDDGLLYRWSMTMSGAAMSAGDATGMLAGDAEVEDLTATFEMFDYGSDIEITPPDPSEVVSGADLGF